jgi:hypothetical protein
VRVPISAPNRHLTALRCTRRHRNGVDRRVVYGTNDTRSEEVAQSAFWRGVGNSTVMLVRARETLRCIRSYP